MTTDARTVTRRRTLGAMRILVTAAPGVGHLLPVLPVAVAARDAGHDVAVATGADLEPIVRRAGLRFVAIGPPSLLAGFAEIDGLAPSGRRRLVRIVSEGFAGIFATAFGHGVLALAADWRPDVIVHEDMEMGSWIAAERLAIPHVVIQATAWRPPVRRIASPSQNELRIRHGLPEDRALDGQDGALWFTTRPPSLRDPAVPLPPTVRELRTAADDRVGQDAAPGIGRRDWLLPSERPRIAVTFGTVQGGRTDLLAAILAGLADLDVEVVVAGADAAAFDRVPANARLERYVPMSELLPRSALVVHHAGSGTMLAAAAAGTPQVMVPIAADQPENAAACAAAGVAIVIRADRLTPALIRAAAERVLKEPSFEERAATVAAEIAAMPDAADAVAAIEAVVVDGPARLVSRRAARAEGPPPANP
jgi:UDP:flavonoid glycosyltransferase YjiC (YdhE family)